MRPVLDILIGALALIPSPETWCQGTYRQLGYRGRVLRRCVIGACIDSGAAIWPGSVGRGAQIDRRVLDALNPFMQHNPAGYNDTHTHAQVITALKRAIARERRNSKPDTDISVFTNILESAELENA